LATVSYRTIVLCSRATGFLRGFTDISRKKMIDSLLWACITCMALLIVIALIEFQMVTVGALSEDLILLASIVIGFNILLLLIHAVCIHFRLRFPSRF
jgi:uncharacterized membrane protein